MTANVNAFRGGPATSAERAAGDTAAGLEPRPPHVQPLRTWDIPELPLSPPGQVVALFDTRQLTLQSLSAWLDGQMPRMRVQPFLSVQEGCGFFSDRQQVVAVALFSIGERQVSDPKVQDDLAQISECLPDVPLVLISDRDEVGEVSAALAHGVRGYVPSSTALNVLVGALQLVLSGGTFIPASAVAQLTRPHAASMPVTFQVGPPSAFTPRQLEVLNCLRRGKSNKIIAYELDMCESTVKVHVRHIMKKLRASNRTQVVFLTQGMFAEEPS